MSMSTSSVTVEASLLGLALVAAGAALGALGVVLGGSHEERDGQEDESSAVVLSERLAKLSEQLATEPMVITPAPAHAPAVATSAAPKAAAPKAVAPKVVSPKAAAAKPLAPKLATTDNSKAPAPTSKRSAEKLKTAPAEVSSKRDKVQTGRATRTA
jgi:hypothetical protein